MAEPLQFEPNYRSPTYSIAHATERCGCCGRSTRVLALVLPEHHETLDSGSDEELNTWQSVSASAILFYVAQLSEGVQRQLLRLSPAFRLAHSDATENCYWTNHCEYCDSPLSDHDLHCEPEGAFLPCNEIEAAGIQLIKIDEPFAVTAAGCAIEPEFFEFMRRA